MNKVVICVVIFFTAGSRIQRKQGEAKWENLDVMFTDYDSTKNLSSNFDEGKGDYIDPPGMVYGYTIIL